MASANLDIHCTCAVGMHTELTFQHDAVPSLVPHQSHRTTCICKSSCRATMRHAQDGWLVLHTEDPHCTALLVIILNQLAWPKRGAVQKAV